MRKPLLAYASRGPRPLFTRMWAATCAMFGRFSSWRTVRSPVLTCSPVSGSVSKMSFFAYQTRVRKYGSWPRSTQLSHQPPPSFWQFCRSGDGSRRGTKRPSGVTSTSNCEYGQMGCIILTMRIDELSLTPWENPGSFLSVSLAILLLLIVVPTDDAGLQMPHPNLRVDVDGDSSFAHPRTEGPVLR